MNIDIKKGDCLDVLANVESESVDVIYLDPPFFTEKRHKLKTRDRSQEYSFDDIWGSHKKYAEFMYDRLVECKRLLKRTGSIFVHCDSKANHILRDLLEEIFGQQNFRSEIIWVYKRWSNSKKGLLSVHQNIYWFSRSKDFYFNTIYTDYSETTNVDQILQQRARDNHGKSVYARDDSGNVILGGKKRGVPLSDVWEIPYLNPKAKERVGYPTQKPLLLLERILAISTKPGDFVLDPFCGSGTTLVAAKIMGRNGLGIDISEDAVELTKQRIEYPVKSESMLLKKGRESYMTANRVALALLNGVDVVPVHRNKGIDGILKDPLNDGPVLIRVQRMDESLSEAARLLSSAAQTKGASLSILIRTTRLETLFQDDVPPNITVVDAPSVRINELVKQLTMPSSGRAKIARR